MRSSSEWVQTRAGTWARAQVQQTRGLNRNHNSTLKSEHVEHWNALLSGEFGNARIEGGTGSGAT